MKTWHRYENAQHAMTTTLIRDEAKRWGLEVDYSRIGWTTVVVVKCTDDEWTALLSRTAQMTYTH